MLDLAVGKWLIASGRWLDDCRLIVGSLVIRGRKVRAPRKYGAG